MDQPTPKPLIEEEDQTEQQKSGGLLHALGTGVITGAADDDPSAIGTYASAGAKFGLAFLWIAPVVLPMMYVVVYVSAKLGQSTARACSRSCATATRAGCSTRSCSAPSAATS